MTKEEYIAEIRSLESHRTELETNAKEIALSTIKEAFPDVEDTENHYFNVGNFRVSYRPNWNHEAEPFKSDFYTVNLLTGTVTYEGSNMRQMLRAAALFPNCYTIEQRGPALVIIVWRGNDEAPVYRFNTDSGQLTGAIYSGIHQDENGNAFISQGKRRIFRYSERGLRV